MCSRNRVVMSVALLLGSSMALQATPARAPDAYARAHALLRAAYPELSGSDLVIMANGQRWQPYDQTPRPFLAMALTVARRDMTRHTEPKPLLTAHVLFTSDETFLSLTVDGEFTNGPQNANLERLAQESPASSTTTVAARLASLGVRFGANQKEEMRREALRQFERIGTVLGPIELIEIQLLSNGTAWRATVLISTPGGRVEYGVLFEPFGGRLVGIGRP